MWKFNSNIYLQIVVLHVGIRRTSNMLSWQNVLTCVPCQSHNPFRLTRVTQATQVTQILGSRLPHCFLLVISLIFPQCRRKISVCILPRVCSLHSAFCTQPAFYSQSAFYPWSAVCSPQSAVCVLHWPEFISKWPCILCLYFFVSPVQIQCSALLFKLFLPYFCFKLLITRTLDNSNRFLISLEGLSYQESTVHVWVIKCYEKLWMPIQYHNDCIWTFSLGIISDYYTYFLSQYKGSATRCHYRPCKTETW